MGGRGSGSGGMGGRVTPTSIPSLSVDNIQKFVDQLQRQVETKPYHDFYRKNASKYGFKYEFIAR